MWIQPATVLYFSPKGEDSRFYGWWGDMEFGQHFLQTLGAVRKGRVEVHFHEPVHLEDVKNRKELAARCEAEIRAAMEARFGES